MKLKIKKISYIIITVIILTVFIYALKNIFITFPKYNILLIVIDALRPDHLSGYGYKRETSPYIDKIMQKSIVFKNAISPSAWTRPVETSILSGLYPKSHGTITRKDILHKDIVILPQILQKHGYYTYAFIANGNISNQFNFNRGYDYFLNLGRKYPKPVHPFAEDANKSLIPFIKNQITEPFFLHVFYVDPHKPYTPPHAIRKFSLYTNKKSSFQTAIDLYDDEILSVDQAVNEILNVLREKKFLKHTIIIITADHGEEFWEHQQTGHGKSLYEESIKVPLIISIPGINARTITHPVSLIDITPTVLDLIRLKVPSYMQGISLIQFAKLRKRKRIFSEINLDKNESYAIRTINHKLIMKKRPEFKMEYYNLKYDAKERNNIYEKHKKNNKIQVLETSLKRWTQSKKYSGMRNKKLNKQQIRILKSLGYIQ